MTKNEYARKFDELDTLLNDPDVPMDPARVWVLLADLAGRDGGMTTAPGTRGGAGSSALAGGGD